MIKGVGRGSTPTLAIIVHNAPYWVLENLYDAIMDSGAMGRLRSSFLNGSSRVWFLRGDRLTKMTSSEYDDELEVAEWLDGESQTGDYIILKVEDLM